MSIGGVVYQEPPLCCQAVFFDFGLYRPSTTYKLGLVGATLKGYPLYVRILAGMRVNDWQKTFCKIIWLSFCREMAFPVLPIPKNAVLTLVVNTIILAEECQSQFACISTPLPV